MSIFLSMLLQAAAASPAAVQQPAAPPDDLKIVCRVLVATGSRLDSHRICLPKKEWRRLAAGGEEETRRLQDQSSRRGPVR